MRFGDREYNLMRRLEDRVKRNQRLGVTRDDHVSAGDLEDAALLLHRLWAEQVASAPSEEVSEEDYPTAEAELIFKYLLPEWRQLFLAKNEHYADVEQLGPKGVFPDVNRKHAVIKSVIWADKPMPEGNEPIGEVICDQIGHLFLMWALWVQEQRPAHTVTYNKGEHSAAYAREIGEVVSNDRAGMVTVLLSGHPDDNIPGTGEAEGDPSEEDEAPSPEYHRGFDAGWSAANGAGSTAGFEDLPPEIQQALRDLAEGARIRGPGAAAAVREFIGDKEF